MNLTCISLMTTSFVCPCWTVIAAGLFQKHRRPAVNYEGQQQQQSRLFVACALMDGRVRVPPSLDAPG